MGKQLLLLQTFRYQPRCADSSSSSGPIEEADPLC